VDAGSRDGYAADGAGDLGGAERGERGRGGAGAEL